MATRRPAKTLPEASGRDVSRPAAGAYSGAAALGADAAASVRSEFGALQGHAAREGSPSLQVPAWSSASRAEGKAALEKAEPAAQPQTKAEGPGAVPRSDLLADDAAEDVGGQMRRTEFLASLRARVCATVDAALAANGRDSEGCPWIDHWFGYYEHRSAAEVERSILKYAPEGAGAISANDYIAYVSERVRRSVESWARTGQVEGMPAELAVDAMPGGSVLGAFGGMFFKAQPGGAREGDPVVVGARLGAGQPLPGGVRTRMESAFGADFSSVRLHADAAAAQLSQQLHARAFTLGEHVAFGAGEFQPGTIVGDALIAHELAHVVQQGGSLAELPQKRSSVQDGALEREADDAAIGAVTTLWTHGKSLQGGTPSRALPRLRASLQLQRCSGSAKKPAAAPNLQTDNVLRQTWEAAFQEGLALLNASVGQKGKDKGCAFPGDKSPEAWRYDTEYWRQVTLGDEMRKYRVAFTPTREPHVSVDQLFAHLERWECDCALFVELTWLYAWRHTLTNAEFDSRFANMRLRPQQSTGLETETHGREDIELGQETDNFEKLWSQAPIGTKVNWINESSVARSPWHFENAVKSKKAAPGGEDLYDAHPMGSGLSEDEIKRGLAENAEDFPGRPFVVTDSTLAEMAAAQASAEFLKNLTAMKDQPFIGKREFSRALAAPAKVLLPLRSRDPDRYAALMKRLFAVAHASATEEEKQAYVDKYIRRHQLMIPK